MRSKYDKNMINYDVCFQQECCIGKPLKSITKITMFCHPTHLKLYFTVVLPEQVEKNEKKTLNLYILKAC